MIAIIFACIFMIIALGLLTETTRPWWFNIICAGLDVLLAASMLMVWDWHANTTWQWIWAGLAVFEHFAGLDELHEWYDGILARKEWERTEWRRAAIFRRELQERNKERLKWQEENL